MTPLEENNHSLHARYLVNVAYETWLILIRSFAIKKKKLLIVAIETVRWHFRGLQRALVLNVLAQKEFSKKQTDR